jgi:AcrR family transcriptional regulator
LATDLNHNAVNGGGSTPARLIAAAERLFAEHGVDGVSLREINQASGARNTMAIQYHFGDRDGLIRAVLDKHLPSLEARRHSLLDSYEADPSAQLRDLGGALVRPYADKLTDLDGGPEFLQLYAALLNRPHDMVEPDALQEPGSSLHRWRRLVDPALDDDAVRLHRRFTAVCHTITELGRRARAEDRHDHRLFISYLVDNVTAILGAPTSAETHILLTGKHGPAVSAGPPEALPRIRARAPSRARSRPAPPHQSEPA